MIDRLAQQGDYRSCTFPKPKLNRNDNRYDFSYSGLKTAVIHQLDRFWNGDYPRTRENIVASFQHAAIAMIIDRVRNAMEDTGIRRVTAGGGVASNSYLRLQLQELVAGSEDARLVLPPPLLCVDNAAMVAGLGYHFLRNGLTSEWDTGVIARVDHFRRRGRPV